MNAESYRIAATELRRLSEKSDYYKVEYLMSANSLECQAEALEAQSPPTVKRYLVTGQVFLADGFDHVIYAADRDRAERLAKVWASDAARVWQPEVQEICINGVTEVD